jgi:hypothetical protein
VVLALDDLLDALLVLGLRNDHSSETTKPRMPWSTGD